MLRKKYKYFVAIIAIVFTIQGNFSYALPSETTTISNNYKIIIEDDAGLLTDGEEKELRSIMSDLTQYGNVMFKTTSLANNYSSSLKYIQNYYYSNLGNEEGVVFYIDMNNRQVCACAAGVLKKTITSAKCNTIMDNIYKFAKNGKYYLCASETFSQMNKLLKGQKIAESMKYICNGFLAIMFSLFASYGVYYIISGNKKASKSDIINECQVSLEHSPVDVKRTGSHSVYSPVSDSDSSSSSGGGRRRWRTAFQEAVEAMGSDEFSHNYITTKLLYRGLWVAF